VAGDVSTSLTTPLQGPMLLPLFSSVIHAMEEVVRQRTGSRPDMR